MLRIACMDVQKFLANWPDSILGSQLAREEGRNSTFSRIGGIERKLMLRLFMLGLFMFMDSYNGGNYSC